MLRICFSPGRHEAYYRSKEAHSVVDPATGTKLNFLPDEMIKVEVSQKVCIRCV